MALKVLKLKVMHQTYSMKGGCFYTGETYRRIQFDGNQSRIRRIGVRRNAFNRQTDTSIFQQ